MTTLARRSPSASERARRSALNGTIRLGVVFCVAVAVGTAAVKVDDVLGYFDVRADTNAAATFEQRAHTYPGWAVSEGRFMEDARLWMPEDARYRVVLGPRFDAERSWDLTRYLLLWYLLPRRPTTSASAEWAFCYGCDEATLGDRFEILSRVPGGPLFGRVSP